MLLHLQSSRTSGTGDPPARGEHRIPPRSRAHCSTIFSSFVRQSASLLFSPCFAGVYDLSIQLGSTRQSKESQTHWSGSRRHELCTPLLLHAVARRCALARKRRRCALLAPAFVLRQLKGCVMQRTDTLSPAPPRVRCASPAVREKKVSSSALNEIA